MTGELIKLLARGLSVGPFCEKLNADSDVWRENTWRQDYVVQFQRPISPQRDTEAVMFRWAPENTIESVRDSLKIEQNPNMIRFPEFLDLYMQCMKACGATEPGRAFVAKLKPGGYIIPHQDYGMYADHFERFHLVLQSDPGNEFFVQDGSGKTELARMSPGEFFWFNHKETHWAVNQSSRPRLHLIMDMVAPKYRRERATVCA